MTHVEGLALMLWPVSELVAMAAQGLLPVLLQHLVSMSALTWLPVLPPGRGFGKAPFVMMSVTAWTEGAWAVSRGWRGRLFHQHMRQRG